MINIVFCGYRSWALQTFEALSSHPKVRVKYTVNSHEEFLDLTSSINPNEIDIIVFLGWSWIIDKKVLDAFLCVGIHPSDLPNFRGGSPLQNQIINGIEKTKLSLITLSNGKLDAGDIWLKNDLDLTGASIKEIFDNLIIGCKQLLNDFFERYPNIYTAKQNLAEGSYFSRRKPSDSMMTPSDFANKSPKELYNFIRCLTDPYPNAYLEDSEGNRILFTTVKYIAAK